MGVAMAACVGIGFDVVATDGVGVELDVGSACKYNRCRTSALSLTAKLSDCPYLSLKYPCRRRLIGCFHQKLCRRLC